jgi:competence protein ComEA
MRLIALMVALFIAVGCDSRPQPAQVLDINRASVAQLEALPGIGTKRARSIVAARNARGGHFTSWGEVLSIDGIGPETVAQLKSHAVLGN